MSLDQKYDVEALKRENPLLRTLENRYSMRFKKQGAEFYTSCPFHKDGSRPNLRVNDQKQLWSCDVCKLGGDVVAFVMQHERLDFSRACEALGAKAAEPCKEVDVSKLIPVATYDYEDQFGELVYQVCRFQTPNPEKESGYDKTFRQRRPDDKGGWLWNMNGVERLPYRVRELLKSGDSIVNIVEGEKDADNLIQLGFTATTNVGGAGKWLAAYSDFFEKRQVAIWPDNDKPGREHAQDVFSKLTGKATNIRMMSVPDPHKDVTDLINSFSDDSVATESVRKMLENATPLYGGIELPIYSLDELEANYDRQVKRSSSTILDLARWLPSLQGSVRGLVPGELAVLLASTGVGKTAWLQNLALNAAPLITLFFEAELPGELCYERFAAAANRIECAEVFALHQMGAKAPWNGNKPNHIFTCPKSPMSCDEMERIIQKSELKIGQRPVLVLIDYIQLIQGGDTRSRYERISQVSERLKVVAKNTGTIIFVASQISRPDEKRESPEVRLYDGKDSGSIENSAGLVLGLWREPNKPWWLNLKVLKNTKGRPTKDPIPCNFSGAKMLINEMSLDEYEQSKQTKEQSKIDPSDVPEPRTPYTEQPEFPTQPQPNTQ